MKNSVLIFSPPRLSGYDVVIPLLYELHTQCDGNLKVIMACKNKNPFYNALNIPEFNFLVSEMTLDIFNIKNNKLIKCITYFFLFYIFFIKHFQYNKFIFLYYSDRSPIARLTLKISSLFGISVIRIPKTAALKTNMSKSADSIPKKNELALSLTPEDTAIAKSLGFRNVVEIAHPHLLKSWKKVIDNYTKERLKLQSKPSVAVLLASTVEGIFDEAELYQWCEDVFYVLSKTHRNFSIALKPHPMNRPHQIKKIIDIARNHHTDISFPVSHICTVASCSPVTIAPVTWAALDAIFFGSNLVVYQTFSSNWLARHPEKSFCSEWGVTHLQDRNYLAAWLSAPTKPKLSSKYLSFITKNKNDVNLFAALVAGKKNVN